MPEGPEIALNHDDLVKYLKGKQLLEIDLLSGKYLKKKPVGFMAFQKDLPAKALEIGILGKFIYIRFNNGWDIGIGFGMNGYLTQNPEDAHLRIKLLASDSSGSSQGSDINQGNDPLFYSDSRNFGNWYFWKKDSGSLDKKLKEFGADLLTSNLTKKQVVNLFRATKTLNGWDVSKSLMSQKVIAGVGNYLRAEGLYASKIYPFAKVSDLSDDDLFNLYKNLVKIAKASYKKQRSWKDEDEDEDKVYEDYQEFMKVYSKKKDPEGRMITRTPGTRTSWWVKSVQTIGMKK